MLNKVIGAYRWHLKKKNVNILKLHLKNIDLIWAKTQMDSHYIPIITEINSIDGFLASYLCAKYLSVAASSDKLQNMKSN